MQKDNNYSRRKFLRASSALSLATVASSHVAAAENDWPVPKRVLGADVKNVVEIPISSGHRSKQKEANIGAVYKVIKKGGDHSFLTVGTADKPVEYKMKIDGAKEEFQVQEVNSLEKESNEIGINEVAEPGNSNSYQVQITQHDPAEVKLCRTRQEIIWFYENGSASTDTRYKHTRAWSPTGAGTNWYQDGGGWAGGYDVIDGGSTVTSTFEASFYNTDFPAGDGWTPGRTDVDHRLTLEGYGDGSSKYFDYIDRSGEGHELLHSHTRVI